MKMFLAMLMLVVTFGASPNLAYAQDAPSKMGTTNTVQTTGDVTASTTISVGTLAGQVLSWIVAVFSVPIGSLLTVWLVRLFKSAGLEMSRQMSEQINRALVNGLNDAAANGAGRFKGTVMVPVGDPRVLSAIQYTIDHVPDTLKALGLDPEDGETVKILRARIATLIADPSTPTPNLKSTG